MPIMSNVDKFFVLVLAVISGVGIGYTMARPSTRMTTYTQRVDTLVREAVRLDTVWRTRKVRYDSLVQQYDTVRLRDTVMVESTVYVPRDIADEAIAACRSVVETCEAQKANLTARLAVAESLLTVPAKPSVWWVLGGFIAGALIK